MSFPSFCRATMLAFALALAGPSVTANAADILVSHAKGATVLPSVPQRVVAYDLAALDTLDALGVEVIALPEQRLPAHLSRYADKRYVKVGTPFVPDIKALTALKPDLIIIGGRSSSRYEELSAIAPTIDLGPAPDDFTNSVIRATLTLGRIFDRNPQAAALVSRYLDTRARLATQIADDDGLALIAAGGALHTSAPGEPFGIFHDLLLIPSVLPAQAAPAQSPRPERGSPEAQAQLEAGAKRLTAALSNDPDWILVLDRPAAIGETPEAPAALAAQPLVAASSAGRYNRVVLVDAAGWYMARGGIQVAQQLLDQMASLIALPKSNGTN